MEQSADKLLICCTCGIQYDTEDAASLDNSCGICLDPRGFVPPPGQQWTTLAELSRAGTIIKWQQENCDSRVWTITAEPKIGIGERALLLQTSSGNVLWDCVPFLDAAAIQWIKSIGGLKAMVISHPHYYTICGEWSKVFNCPVYISPEDKQWISRPKAGQIEFIEGKTQTIVEGVTAIKTGGHFDGSLLLHWEDHLFHADTFLVVMSGLSPMSIKQTPGKVTYSFMYSPPNMLPLSADAVLNIWRGIEPFNFKHTHGAFSGNSISGGDLKERFLHDIKVFTILQGHKEHDNLKLSLV